MRRIIPKVSYVIKVALVLLAGIFICSTAVWADSTLKVASIQLRTSDAGNFTKMLALVKQAKAQGAVLVIFPEESVFGWLNPAAFTKATPIPGKYSDQFAAIAKEERIWLAAGLAEQGPKAGPGSQPDAHQVYDSGILINPDGQIVLHHRQFNVIQNAFDPAACKSILGEDQCNYIPGELSDITTVSTPFGKTSILVCAEAYTYSPGETINILKKLQPDFVIVPWGITASTISECGTHGFNATDYAAEAATYLNSFVIGSNPVGPREYGRFLPSIYCGTSGYADPTGSGTEATQPTGEIVYFQITQAESSKIS